MIDRIYHTDQAYMMIADEPTPQLEDILQVASKDASHPLFANYKRINMKRFLFYNIAVHNETPFMFFGTEHADWMPAGVARGLTRFYKHPLYRQNDYWHLQRWVMKSIDYSQYGSWTDKFNIQTILATRNIADKQDATRYMTKGGWNLYPNVCHINNVDQYVYWRGEPNLSFLENLHSLDKPPTRID